MSEWGRWIVDAELGDLEELIASLPPGHAYLGHDLEADRESLRTKLLDLAGIATEHLVFVSPMAADAMHRAASDPEGADRLRIVSERPFARAAFAFVAEAPSRDVAHRLHTALATLPETIELLGFSESTHEDRGARGIEMFAPEHSLQYRASGRIAGAAAAVLALRVTLAEIDFVRLDRLELDSDVVDNP